jgi:hypothetical protein
MKKDHVHPLSMASTVALAKETVARANEDCYKPPTRGPDNQNT